MHDSCRGHRGLPCEGGGGAVQAHPTGVATGWMGVRARVNEGCGGPTCSEQAVSAARRAHEGSTESMRQQARRGGGGGHPSHHVQNACPAVNTGGSPLSWYSSVPFVTSVPSDCSSLPPLPRARARLGENSGVGAGAPAGPDVEGRVRAWDPAGEISGKWGGGGRWWTTSGERAWEHACTRCACVSEQVWPQRWHQVR